MSIEEFRKLVGGFIKSLNRDSTQYKIAKRYGFIVEVEKKVVFYFETFVSSSTTITASEENTSAGIEIPNKL